MRCQKACSYLPAYCNNELSGEKQIEVSEHLTSCQECRREEAMFQAIRVGSMGASPKKVSANFNATLLNRIAEERFAETRTAANLPRTSPRLFARGFVPAFAASVAAIAAVAISLTSSPMLSNPSGSFASASNLDDSYLTAQPVNNPNLTSQLPKDWSMNNHLARSERYNRLSTSVAPTWASFASTSNPIQYASRRGPYSMTTTFQARPIVRQYISTNGAVLTFGGVGTY